MDHETAVLEVTRLLERLRPVRGRSSGTRRGCFYGGARPWPPDLIRRDLWRRACEEAENGRFPYRSLQLWGHWYGISDGYAWSRAEILRRFRTGRTAAESAAARVTRAVARSLLESPPGAARPAAATQEERADVEDGAAVALGRAVTARHRHHAEIRYALHDALERHQGPGGRAGRRRLPNGTVARKPNLKTARYMSVAHTALRRAVADTGARSAAERPGARHVVLPLWEAIDPETADLEETLVRLRTAEPSADRAGVARLLREGHHHILQRPADRELICAFLLDESKVLGRHDNIGRAAILEVVEGLLEPTDPRRVDAARERVRILERHHYWAAAWAWSQRLWQRLRDPRVRWADADDKRVAVARALVRQTSLAAKYASVSPEDAPADLSAMARRAGRVLDEVGDPGRVREWRILAQRRELQARWAAKNRDRLLGLPARWEEEELAVIEAIDRSAAGLEVSRRMLAWHNQKLNVLLTADRPADFQRAVDDFLPELVAKGETWPSEVCAAHHTLELALRRRSKRWLPLREELAAWLAKLPAHTDETLRNPYAIPRHLVVNGVCIG